MTIINLSQVRIKANTVSIEMTNTKHFSLYCVLNEHKDLVMRFELIYFGFIQVKVAIFLLAKVILWLSLGMFHML